jgi:hypothetical protein
LRTLLEGVQNDYLRTRVHGVSPPLAIQACLSTTWLNRGPTGTGTVPPSHSVLVGDKTLFLIVTADHGPIDAHTDGHNFYVAQPNGQHALAYRVAHGAKLEDTVRNFVMLLNSKDRKYTTDTSILYEHATRECNFTTSFHQHPYYPGTRRTQVQAAALPLVPTWTTYDRVYTKYTLCGFLYTVQHSKVFVRIE